MKQCITVFLFVISCGAMAQQPLTPETMWQLGRVSPVGISADKKWVVYSVATPDMQSNKSNRQSYIIPISGGSAMPISNKDTLMVDKNISPDGKFKISNKEVKVKKIEGKDRYADADKSNVYVFDSLMVRHWDQWEDGAFDHVFLTNLNDGSTIDLMPDEPFDAPTKPFGGEEDYVWSSDGKQVVYVAKKKFGTAYALSTNTDLYAYDIATKKTTNLTEGMMGYDINPAYNQFGQLAWLSMKRDGFEADKQDIVVLADNKKFNLTKYFDHLHVESFKWANDGKSIYFNAPINGTLQLFNVYVELSNKQPLVKQITKGDYDITGIVGETSDKLIVTKTDFNHAAEIFSVDKVSGNLTQLTNINDAAYSNIQQSKFERRFVKTTDGKQMLVWVIYPPNFDPTKKYPTLLYCQGGPQSPLTQFYSFRWNFQLMAANGYIVVAPNRRGMPGHGTKWNEAISKNWGEQVMRDYLSAIDDVAKEKYVDKARLGAVGASFGGYSVFYLAGIHNKKFKTFIAHDGVFNLTSMYGTTEELWFVNWDIGGNYWDKKNVAAQSSYSKFNPINMVDKWTTPILIYQGGKDYRVPIGQGLEAFTAAQMRGIKSRLVYLPDENHWVLQAQNALVWQREFFNWLKETL